MGQRRYRKQARSEDIDSQNTHNLISCGASQRKDSTRARIAHENIQPSMDFDGLCHRPRCIQ